MSNKQPTFLKANTTQVDIIPNYLLLKDINTLFHKASKVQGIPNSNTRQDNQKFQRSLLSYDICHLLNN